MTRAPDWQTEWNALRAERDVARRKWRRAADGLAAHARDPFDIGAIVRAHPGVTAGVGAAIGAVLVKLLLGRPQPVAPKAPAGSAGPEHEQRGSSGSVWTTILRDAAITIAVPWLLDVVKRKFGCDLNPAAPPPSAGSAVADSTPAA